MGGALSSGPAQKLEDLGNLTLSKSNQVKGELGYQIAINTDPNARKMMTEALLPLMQDAVNTANNAGLATNPIGFVPIHQVDMMRSYSEWVINNPDAVKALYAQGGGEAVWGSFADTYLNFEPSKGLGGNNLAAVSSGFFGDVGNYLDIGGGALVNQGLRMPGRAGKALQVIGRAVQPGDTIAEGVARGVPAVARRAGATSAGRAARESRIGTGIASWFDTDPRVKANNLVEQTARGIAQEDAAGIVHIADPDAATPATAGLAQPDYQVAVRPERSGDAGDAESAFQERVRSAAGTQDIYGQAMSSVFRRTEDLRLASRNSPFPDQVEGFVPNTYEWWQVGFDAELAARQAGGKGPHINNFPENSVGFYLDELAWSSDPGARRRAADYLAQRPDAATGDPDAFEKAVTDAVNNPFNSAGIADPDPAHWLDLDEADRAMMRGGRAEGGPRAETVTFLDEYLKNAQIETAAGNSNAYPNALKQTRDALKRLAEPEDPWLRSLPREDAELMRLGMTSRGAERDLFESVNLRLRSAYDTMSGNSADPLGRIKYEDATQFAVNMIGDFKRSKDFARDYAERLGRPNTVIPTGGFMAQAADAMDRSVRLRGPVPDATEELLGQTFSPTNKNYAGRSFRDVARETRGQSQKEYNELKVLLFRKENRQGLGPGGEQRLQELLDKYPKLNTYKKLGKVSADDLWKDTLRGEFYQHLDIGPANRFWRGIDTLNSNFAVATILAPWRMVRTYIGNQTGNSLQVLLKLGLGDMAEMNVSTLDGELGGIQAALMNYAVRGGDISNTAAGRFYARTGMGGFNPGTVGSTMQSGIFERLDSHARKVGGRATFNAPTRLADWTPIKLARSAMNGQEWGHRTSLHVMHARKNLIAARPGYIEEIAGLAKNHGINGQEVDDAIRGLGPEFSGRQAAEVIGELAMSKGVSEDGVRGLADQAGRRWANRVNQADSDALKTVNSALFNLDPKNIDKWARRVIPFHMWASRALPFYSEQMLRHPGFTNAFYGLTAQTEKDARENNWPDSMVGLAQAWNGPGGMIAYVHPLTMIGAFDIAAYHEAQNNPYDDPQNVWQDMKQKLDMVGFGFSPLVSAILDSAGVYGDSPAADPIGVTIHENQIRAFLEAGVKVGIFPAEWRRHYGRPLAQTFENNRAWRSEQLAKLGIGEYIPANDVSGGDEIKVRNQMLANHLVEEGLTLDQYYMMIAAAESEHGDPYGENARRVDEINQSVADDYLDQNAAYLRALDEVNEGEMGATLIRSLIPGRGGIRQETGLDIQTTASAAGAFERGEDVYVPGLGLLPDPQKGGSGDILSRIDPFTLQPITEASLRAHPEQLDARDRAFLTAWAQRFGQDYRKGDLERFLHAARTANEFQQLTPEAATLEIQKRQRDALGSKKENRILDEYYDIRNGVRAVKISRKDEGLEDIALSADQVRAQDSDMRNAIADVWLAHHDKDGEIRALKEAKSLFGDTHPEYGAFSQWRRDTEDQWGDAATFRRENVKANPNYANYINAETSRLRRSGKSPSEIEAELDRWITFSSEAYFAHNGWQWNNYDPLPRETGSAPIPVASSGAPLSALSGGGSNYSGSGSGSSWDTRVRDAIAQTQAARQAQLSLYGITFAEMVPFAARVQEANAAPEAIEPEDAWIFYNYLEWRQQRQAAGTDDSIDAFIASTRLDKQEDKLAGLAAP